jgi:hypothetical protein
MIHRPILTVAASAGRNRLISQQASTVARHFSTASTSSSYTNPSYDVEGYHRQEVLEALRTVSQGIRCFVDYCIVVTYFLTYHSFFVAVLG